MEFSKKEKQLLITALLYMSNPGVDMSLNITNSLSENAVKLAKKINEPALDELVYYKGPYEYPDLVENISTFFKIKILD